MPRDATGNIYGMDALTNISAWLTDSASLGQIVGGSILIVGVLLALVLGIILSANGKRAHRDTIERELNHLAPKVMNVAIDASMYSSLDPQARAEADRQAIAIDMRIRLLDRDGAAEAADWLSARFASLRHASTAEQSDASRGLDHIRENFLVWAYDPRAGLRAFKRDELDFQRKG